MKKGVFITVEGTDGCGKTSVLTYLRNQLAEKNLDILWTYEPGGTDNKIANCIRELILDPANSEMDARTEALLYAASRRQHLVQTILPALEEGRIVISDRYVDSSLVYQGVARGLGMEEVAKINAYATEGKEPDITIFLDVKPEISLARRNHDTTRDMDRLDQEPLKFHQAVYDGYQKLIHDDPDRFIVIDASQDLQSEEEAVLQAVLRYLHA